MSDLLADPRFWGIVVAGAAVAWLYSYNHLRGRDWRHPLGFALGAVGFGLFALGFAVFGWRGFAVMIAISALGWLGAPLASALARRRR
jgi:hypothetical protein